MLNKSMSFAGSDVLHRSSTVLNVLGHGRLDGLPIVVIEVPTAVVVRQSTVP